MNRFRIRHTPHAFDKLECPVGVGMSKKIVFRCVDSSEKRDGGGIIFNL